mmetsp:Transcript_30763/g.77516  ORF Transcript_30763/g.77516 Transcript_30763/m.77516 type:complete len:244 (-) Transcript_30763:193-924(-)
MILLPCASQKCTRNSTAASLLGFMIQRSFFCRALCSRYAFMNRGVIGHQTSTHCTLARYPCDAKSCQSASYSLGPMRFLSSLILSSSLTSVAVSPSLQCALTTLSTCQNLSANDKCTSSNTMMPHCRALICSIRSWPAWERFLSRVIIGYVVMRSFPSGLSLQSDPLLRKQVMSLSFTSVQVLMNCCFHCVTAIEVLQMTAAHFLTFATALIPTSVLPAPHGSTMKPDRALPLLNILLRLFSW